MESKIQRKADSEVAKIINSPLRQDVLDRYFSQMINVEETITLLGVHRSAFYRYLRQEIGVLNGRVPENYPHSIPALKKRIAELEAEIKKLRE